MTDIATLTLRWRELAEAARTIQPTRLSLDPSPTQIKAVLDDLDALIAKVDPLVQAYGEYVSRYTGHRIEPRFYENQLASALEGNLTFEISSAAEMLAEDMMENA